MRRRRLPRAVRPTPFPRPDRHVVPVDGGASPSLTICRATETRSGSSVPNGLLERIRGIIMPRFRRFVPQVGDKGLRLVLGCVVTHPPVVFGPHRSPRDEGRPLFQLPDAARTPRSCSCNIWVTISAEVFPFGGAPIMWASSGHPASTTFQQNGST